MKLIGRGAFTRCYLESNGEFVTLKSIDPIKEAMSIGFPCYEGGLFPKVERIDIEVYRMKYYPRVSSLKRPLDPNDWTFYKLLRQMGEEFLDTLLNANRPNDGYFFLWEILERYRDDFPMYDTEWEEIQLALSACANYGTDVMFEISPRNVAVDNGKLVLLDVFFMRSTLSKVRGTK